MEPKKPLTKKEIIDTIVKETGVTTKAATGALDAIVGLVYKNAKNSITIPGLGKFSVEERKARTGRNPKTGEAIEIKAKDVVKFKVAKACQDAVTGEK